MSNEAPNPTAASANSNTHQSGKTLPDRSSGTNRTDGSANPDILISDAGNDMLVGKDGVDTYVINNTNLERVVTIRDQGVNRLVIEGGNKMMQLDIRKDGVLLDGKPLEKADESVGGGNSFVFEIENLTVLIKPDFHISHGSQTSEAAIPKNPLLQNMSHLPHEYKLAVLNHMHEQLQQQTLAPKPDHNQEADSQLA